MKKTIVSLLALLGITASGWAQEPADTTTLVRVGEQMPAFAVKTLDGQTIDSAALVGKVVLVNFWATWCPPCRQELPLLQKDVWDAFRGKEFVMVAVSRGEKEETVRKFLAGHPVSFPVALDPDKKVYGLFATQSIPRSFVVDKRGVVCFASIGYQEQEFRAMVARIAAELKR